MCLHWCLPWGFFLAVGYADMRIFSWPWSWFSFWRYGLFETAFHGLSDYRSMFFAWCSHVSLSGIVVWEVNFCFSRAATTANSNHSNSSSNKLVGFVQLPPSNLLMLIEGAQFDPYMVARRCCSLIFSRSVCLWCPLWLAYHLVQSIAFLTCWETDLVSFPVKALGDMLPSFIQSVLLTQRTSEHPSIFECSPCFTFLGLLKRFPGLKVVYSSHKSQFLILSWTGTSWTRGKNWNSTCISVAICKNSSAHANCLLWYSTRWTIFQHFRILSLGAVAFPRLRTYNKIDDLAICKGKILQLNGPAFLFNFWGSCWQLCPFLIAHWIQSIHLFISRPQLWRIKPQQVQKMLEWGTRLHHLQCMSFGCLAFFSGSNQKVFDAFKRILSDNETESIFLSKLSVIWFLFKAGATCLLTPWRLCGFFPKSSKIITLPHLEWMIRTRPQNSWSIIAVYMVLYQSTPITRKLDGRAIGMHPVG